MSGDAEVAYPLFQKENGGSIPTSPLHDYHVQGIKREEARPWILTKHYAHRMPSVQYAYGLYKEKTLEGVVTFGPTCRSLNRGYGIFKGKYECNSFELVRLCLESENKNAASLLIASSMKMLPKPCFVVSYADANQGHVGYVYQATNWIYTGITAKEKKCMQNGKELHARTVVSRYGTRKQEALPDDIGITEQEGKHRYVYFMGNKQQKKAMRKAMSYPTLPYPKGESKRYDSSGKVFTQQLLF